MPSAKLILQRYAPTETGYGFHFKAYDNRIFTPIIRQEIRNTAKTTGSHYTVYLPSYSDGKVLTILSEVENASWEIFSKHTDIKFFWRNCTVRPITNRAFVESNGQ